MNQKKRKRSSPWRIKIGCGELNIKCFPLLWVPYFSNIPFAVVALRYQSGGNQIIRESSILDSSDLPQSRRTQSDEISPTIDSLPVSEVWSNPLPGHDEGLALVGSRIRCRFPSFVLSKTYHTERATTQFLEGIIIGIVDYESQFLNRKLSHRRREAYGTKVDLLISKDMLKAMPFLANHRSDRTVDVSQLSESGKREHENEERVKGADKTVVRVVLADSSGFLFNKPTSPNNNKPEVKWAIRKRVLEKNFFQAYTKRNLNLAVNEQHDLNEMRTSKQTEKRQKLPGVRANSMPKFIGDGNDSEKQQEANWRWQSSRYNPISISKTIPTEFRNVSCLLSNFVGEVIRMETGSSTSKSLAMVTLKRLILPEHTERGRMSHHGANDIFEDLESKCYYYQVPVEELVIISRRLNAVSSLTQERKGLLLNASYSTKYNSYVELSQDQKDTSGLLDNSQLCCRCRRFIRRQLSGQESCNQCGRCIKILKEIMQHNSGHQIEEEDIGCNCNGCFERRNNQMWHKSFFEGAMSAMRLVDKNSADNNETQEKNLGDSPEFANTRALLQAMGVNDFRIFRDFLPEAVPSKKPRLDFSKTSKPSKKYTAPSDINLTPPRPNYSESLLENDKEYKQEDRRIVATTCSRIFPYNATTRNFEVSANEILSSTESSRYKDKQRNLRLLSIEKSFGKAETDNGERFLNNRALRAKQRRLVRDVAAAGVSLDTLIGREQQLRFDRSKIHAWGVFADDEIKENEMIVEYRGVSAQVFPAL